MWNDRDRKSGDVSSTCLPLKYPSIFLRTTCCSSQRRSASAAAAASTEEDDDDNGRMERKGHPSVSASTYRFPDDPETQAIHKESVDFDFQQMKISTTTATTAEGPLPPHQRQKDLFHVTTRKTILYGVCACVR